MPIHHKNILSFFYQNHFHHTNKLSIFAGIENEPDVDNLTGEYLYLQVGNKARNSGNVKKQPGRALSQLGRKASQLGQTLSQVGRTLSQLGRTMSQVGRRVS